MHFPINRRSSARSAAVNTPKHSRSPASIASIASTILPHFFAGTRDSITCPYHAWTYDLAGALVHVPHEATFAGLDRAARGLAPVACHEADGLIWLGEDAAAHAAPLARDLAALDLGHHVVFRRATAVRAANWKLVIEAFLDGYHIRVLHRDSIYRFFVDAAVAAERAGPHVRAVTARRPLRDAAPDLGALPPAQLRALGTPSYLIFPATIAIVHPDFVSLVTVHPRGAGACTWEHAMLVPAARADEREHWERSWALIEDGVFQREDLWVCEQAQQAIDRGATTEVLFGALEEPAAWFHAALAAIHPTA